MAAATALHHCTVILEVKVQQLILSLPDMKVVTLAVAAPAVDGVTVEIVVATAVDAVVATAVDAAVAVVVVINKTHSYYQRGSIYLFFYI